MIRSFILCLAASAVLSAPMVQDKTTQDPPAVVKHVDPIYPKPIPKDSAQGAVFVKLIIDSNGDVSSATVLKSEVGAPLMASALEAARQWKFAPAPKGEKRAMIEVVLPFRFKLSEDKKK
jgi:protein TonB